MPNYTLSNTKNSYQSAWDSMVIHPDVLPKAQAVADKIIALKDRYTPLEIATGIPWYFIGLLHMRESNFNFNTHLHNGDPLNENGRFKRTTHVPKGRPFSSPQDGVTYSFEESALDALKYEFSGVKSWDITSIAFLQETYNGFGYRNKGLSSPYLWAGSNQYVRGKFIRDHVFDPTVVDSQLGVMVVLKCILDKSEPVVQSEIMNGALEAVKAPMSPAADTVKPKSTELRKTSRKFKLTEWMQSLFMWTTGGTVVGKTLDVSNIQATRTYMDMIKSFVTEHGVWLVVFGLIAACVATQLLKEWMKQDVEEGRSTPSGEV